MLVPVTIKTGECPDPFAIDSRAGNSHYGSKARKEYSERSEESRCRVMSLLRNEITRPDLQRVGTRDDRERTILTAAP